ncbi:uncharacterized protein LOC122847746 [Aphidius gifuensis]|uniref:uncharacterized protein LOC122847746 n=1 Tax=Aphidius gifuensis TaxID=684658 RepID=UPI001CDBE243|nr:uncharacterized protein LOC122847746 [Aphidius gifuensis]
MVNQCCAIGCGKKQSKGTTILKAFPRDPDRRQKWATAAGVSQIKPSLRLCELHFDASQYEQHRQDGLKKLKPNAVPTLFGDVLTDYLSKDHQDKSNTIHDASWTSCESLNQLSTMDLDESLSSSLPNVSDVIIDECTTDNPTSLSELPKSDNTKSVPSDEQQIELPLINLDKEHSVSIFTHNVYPDTLNSVSSIPADELHAELINKYKQEVIKLNLMLQDQHRLHQHEISSLSKEVESLKKINIRLEGELRVEQEKRIKSE